MLLLAESTTLESTYCAACGVVFAAPECLLRQRREEGGSFFCPNGHSLRYTKSEVQKLRDRLDRAEARVQFQSDQREAAERSAAAQRGANTKLRKRIAAGVCPCCHRSFSNLQRHMSGQHADYAGGES